MVYHPVLSGKIRWCANEIEKALEKGYEILEIYEVWNYPQKSSSLFKEYVGKFIKIKIEASGGVENEKEFRKRVFEKLGIELEELKKNAGKRTIAKLCLNYLWGHFG